jgi:hypothetical protein
MVQERTQKGSQDSEMVFVKLVSNFASFGRFRGLSGVVSSVSGQLASHSTITVTNAKLVRIAPFTAKTQILVGIATFLLVKGLSFQ